MAGLIALAHSGPARLSADTVAQVLRHRGPDRIGPDRPGQRAMPARERLFEIGHIRLGAGPGRPGPAGPMRSADQRWIVACDGEIANDDALRSYLAARYRTDLRGTSTTETLTELIARDGVPSAVERLDGLFAFVALDRASGSLYAARDAAGGKPLYFIAEGGAIGIASTVRALAAHGFDPGEPDPIAIATYLRLHYVPSDRSIRSRLRRVPSGTLLSWHDGRIDQRPFRYQKTPTVTALGGRDPIGRFGAQLDKAVADRLRGAGPVGLLLSDGLDSAVLAAALKKTGVSAPCFTIGFAGRPGSVAEIAEAAATARAVGLPHRPLVLTVDDLIAADKLVTTHLEEPLGTPGTLALWHLAGFARSLVAVAFAGQGAGIPFGGWRRYRLEALRIRLPDAMRGGLRRGAALLGVAPARLAPNGLAGARRALQTLGEPDWLAAYVTAREVFRPDEIEAFGAGPGPEPSRLFAPWLRRLNRLAPGASDLHRSLWLDTRTELADALLLATDKIATAHGLDLRLPLLAAPLLDLLEQTGDDWRVTPLESKRLLRAHARRVLPEAVLAVRPAERRSGLRVPNLFREPRFLEESQSRVASQLGTALGWRIDPLVAAVARGARGGNAELRAWTLHALARWLESAQTAEATTAPMDRHPRGAGVDAGIAS